MLVQVCTAPGIPTRYRQSGKIADMLAKLSLSQLYWDVSNQVLGCLVMWAADVLMCRNSIPGYSNYNLKTVFVVQMLTVKCADVKLN